MTKDEFGWLIVRALGAFLLLLVVVDLLSVFLTILNAFITHNKALSLDLGEEDAYEQAIRYGRLYGQIWSLGIGIVFKGVFAYYCFYRGAWIHGLITSRLPTSDPN